MYELVAFGREFTWEAPLVKRKQLIIFLLISRFFSYWLQNSIIDLNFIVDPKLMNKKHYTFWLRFIFFFFVFAVAFFLMIFVVDTNPSFGFRMLLIKIGILATVSSLFYNILVKPDPEIVDWRAIYFFLLHTIKSVGRFFRYLNWRSIFFFEHDAKYFNIKY